MFVKNHVTHKHVSVCSGLDKKLYVKVMSFAVLGFNRKNLMLHHLLWLYYEFINNNISL